ncbi:ataxia telangiectasia mutated family protein [Cinnamomum micranthum f. kanehirae]|uniref:cellulase n=1 Tax=Cinnamomum micranthum f. kanehirae TaxID=337451 RepID=A0A3S3N2W7_9MAGN|nr:ataxia telangiectasia mutated family protein [Cinnamomum micranthum f. kanehirae]
MECKFSQSRTPGNIEVSLGTQKIVEKENFRYLGSTVQQDGGIHTDVSHRIQAGWTKWRSASGALCDRKVPLKVKGKYYKVAVRPALLYGSECWTVKHNHVKKMEVAEMRMLRWMCGITRRDRIRNEEIWGKVGIAPIGDKMRENRLKWFGHVRRRPTEAPVKRCESMEIAMSTMLHYTSSSSFASIVQGTSRKGGLSPVTFGENGQPIGDNSVQLSSKIGEIVRTYVSPVYLKWTDVPNELKELVWEIVSHSFEVPEYSKRLILKKANSSWKDWKSNLQLKVIDKYQTDVERKSNIPEGVKKEDWESFIELISTSQAHSLRQKARCMKRVAELKRDFRSSKASDATWSCFIANCICLSVVEMRVDLVGGYDDAGDNVKFGLPMDFTITMMSWSIVEYGKQMAASGELGHAMEAVKWGTDYLIKAHPEPNVLYGEEKFCNDACVERFQAFEILSLLEREHWNWYEPLVILEAESIQKLLIADEFSAELADGVACVAGHDQEARPVMVLRIKQDYQKFHSHKM